MWTAIGLIAVTVVTSVTSCIQGIITRRRVREVRHGVGEVKEIVNGPLTLALKENAALSQSCADLSQRLYSITGTADDRKAAIEAAALALNAAAVIKNREEGKIDRAVEAALKERDIQTP